MTEIKLKKETLKTYFDAIGNLVTECRVVFTENGLETKAVDTANAAMVHARIPKEVMDAYTSPDCIFGIEMEKIRNAIAIMGEEDLTLEVDAQKMTVRDGKTEYRCRSVDPSTIRKEPNIPNLTLPAIAEFSGATLAESIKNLGKISEKITFDLNGKTLTLSAEGAAEDRLDRTIEVERTGDASAIASFSLDYLLEMAKAFRAVDKLTLEMNTDHPLRVKFEVGGVSIVYLLAPRVETAE